MDKFAVKDWFDLDEAAEYLTSSVKGSTFSTKDIIHLFLQDKLILSIFLADVMVGKPCRFLNEDEYIDDFVDEDHVDTSPFAFCAIGLKTLMIDGENICEIKGICDLSMLGSEKYLVFDCLKSDYDLGKREKANDIGMIVSQNGVLYQLCEYWGEKDDISIYNPLYYDKKSELKNAFLCVRKENLESFSENYFKEKRKANSKTVDALESNSQKKMIIAMACDRYMYNPRSKRSDVATSIVVAADDIGLTIDKGTVRKWLKNSSELLDQEILDELEVK